MKNKIALISFILLCEFVGIAGSFFTADAIPAWYTQLNQPSFLPPNWIFGPVWTVLYAMIGVVLFRIWKRGLKDKENLFVFKVFLVQLFLNAIWTPIFFGMKNLGLAFIVIVLLWLSIGYLIYLFLKSDKTSSWLLLPYLFWVSFATALNLAFFLLN